MTKYTNLSLQEFVRLLRTKDVSPLFEEAADRLEGFVDRSQESNRTTKDCPVCEAAITIEYDGSEEVISDRFTVKDDS